MLNIDVNRSAKGVEQYFDCELAVSDYLMKEPGIWAGRGAERLGLHGPLQRSQFVALLRNENPMTGKRLTARTNTSRQEDGEKVSNRQVGYGLVFGVPKSLSIYLAITRDQVVENIARSAVDETVCAIEYEMQCKIRKEGLHEDRRTGELLYSKFFHRDSRPINGLSDPHWHGHCFLHNATFDPMEERWKAGQFRGMIADKGYYQEYFHTLLAQGLMESGHKLRRTDRRFQARTFQGFQLRPECADVLVIDEASMLSVPQMLWLVKYARENDSRVLLVGDSAQHRSVERGDALRVLEQSGTVRYVELLQTQRQKVPALKAAIEDLKTGRLQAGWEKLEHYGVIKEFTDGVELREKAVEQHLVALRGGKTSLMISPRHDEARKVAAVVRQQLKAEGAIGAEDYAVTVLRRMDLGPEACRDLLHYEPGRVVGFHNRTAGGFRPGEKWTVREANCETVTLERNGKVRQFKPSAKGKWEVLVSSTMQVSVGDQIRVTAGFREGKNVFKNNDIAQVREVTDTELALDDGRRMRRNGARIDQGICITSHASQCRTVDQVVVLPDGADAKGWYVSLSRAREAMHVFTRNKAALRQSVMQPGERKSIWELAQVVQRSNCRSRHAMMPDLWVARQAEKVRGNGMER